MEDSDFRDILDDLVSAGWSVRDEFLPSTIWQSLAAESEAAFAKGAFKAAGVGRGLGRVEDARIRSDHILWLDSRQTTSAQRIYLERLECLRQCLNRNLYLGLEALEIHFARYAPGCFYRKHLDQFRGVLDRQVTVVFYLNEDWQPEEGGALRLYLDDEGTTKDIMPYGGRLLVFLSGRFYHEVLPARRLRLSLTGWFKRMPRQVPIYAL